MSVRNRPEAKAKRRRERSIRKGVLPTYIDLLAWMKMRANISTGRAISVAKAGCLKVDSHTIGRKEVLDAFGHKMFVFDRYVPTSIVGAAGCRIELHPEPVEALIAQAAEMLLEVDTYAA